MIRKGFHYQVSKVKDVPGKNGNYLSFSIRDKVKDSPPKSKWQWYNVNSNSPVVLVDGDNITIESINGIASRYYNGKIYYTIYADATVKPVSIP